LINEGQLANLCHVSILPPSWLFCRQLGGKKDIAYFILWATGRSGPENML